ncbi:hypothetical protein ACHAWO_013071 [Cyclotella atomus]|uniref:Pre-mRNA-processing factor 17 n=1 Tax=Cyclotella atomus TaxID=382360 RepID=A0ABD3NMN3_9STRA
MDLLSGYASTDSESPSPNKPILRRPLNSAPIPSVSKAVLRASNALVVAGGSQNAGTALVGANLGIHAQGPIQGPALTSDPSDKTSSFIQSIDPKTGSTSKMEANVHIDEFTFSQNRNAFQRGSEKEIALAPGEVAGDTGREIKRNDYGHQRRFKPNYGEDFNAFTGEFIKEGDEQQPNPQESALVAGQKRAAESIVTNEQPLSRRARKAAAIASEGPLLHSADDDLTYGIWGPPSATEQDLAKDSVPMIESGLELHPRIKAERAYIKERDRQRGIAAEGGDEKEKFDRMVERKMAHLLPPRMEGENPVAIEATTTFHGEEEVDYRGRSWIAPPSGLRGVDENDVDDHACFVPKKCVARLTGHEKGVHRIRLFPRTGHLLLSAGLDGKCKVWSVETRKVMRTYAGHAAAVRDVQFNHNGTKFVSASFDRYLRLWDTESGQVLNTFTNRRVPYVVKFYPHDDNIFVVGCSDNKIVAYDATTGEITQEYDHHLAPVNTITFVEDNGTKMVTSSDDKKVLVWEWDIGVPIKYISDPTMHSMPVMTMHPSQSYMLGQSLDNKIVVYQAGERYSLQRKKKFAGHNVAGYACDITISPDGRFVCSGDADGKLCFWDFKKTKMLQKYHAHDKGPSIGAVWHPVDPSVVFSCGWDGVIKMWQ